MGNRFDYNEEEVMMILNDATKSDEEKKAAFEAYQKEKLDERKTEIINRLNECAKENPMITQEKYITMLKKYSNDDLSIPFDSIIADIEEFDKEMKAEYDKYLEAEKAKEVTPVTVEEPVKPIEPVVAETTIPESPVEEAPVSVEIDPNAEVSDEDITPDVTPFSNTIDANPFFDDNQKEVIPNNDDSQRGNATAIIISVITIIIGIVIMYSIIRLK